MIGLALSAWKYVSGVLSPRLTIAADGTRLNIQPTGAVDLALSTTKYVNDNDFWIRTATLLTPKTSTDDVEWGAFRYADATTGGVTNTFVGLTGNTTNTGDRNVALGYFALNRVASGSQNFASGANALGSLTTGSNNVAIGSSAGLALLSGINNMLIGQNAGRTLSTGSANTFIGDSCGYFSTSSSNVGIGLDSCKNLTNSGNVGVGINTLLNMTNSIGNTAIGFGALTGGVGSTAKNTVGIGRDSGWSLTTGQGNVLLGYNSGYGLTTESNRLIIENSTDIITPLIYGEFDNKILEVNGSLEAKDEMIHGNLVWISNIDQLPTPVSNVITLLANTTYYFTANLDLLGDRLVGSENTCILGSSSECAFITSTGLGASVALFTTDYTTAIRHVSFHDVGTCIDIDGSRSGQTPALDWTGVNFVDIPDVGTIKDVGNFIFSKGALLNSQGLIFDGTIGTVGIDNSIFTGDGSVGNIFEVKSTAIITRRFRIIYSSIVAFTSTVGIEVNASATIPSEGYILDTVNFSGGGTYISGVAYTDDKARFIGVRGVSNSAEIGSLYMIANATVTTITTISTPVKILGTTTLNTNSQKFTHASNKLTYDGALNRTFKINCVASFTSGNNKNISLFVAKNGVVDASSEIQATTDGNGKSEGISCQTIVEMIETDYIEIWIANNSGSNDITVQQLNFTVLGLVS
jgi:hypothetical protein